MRQYILPALLLFACGSNAAQPDAASPDGGSLDGGTDGMLGTVDATPADAAPADAGPDAPPAVPANYAFLTSTKYGGNFGGAAMADTICQTHATAAGLPGTFKAFLSAPTPMRDARAQFLGAAGWRQVGDLPVMDHVDEMFFGELRAPVTHDELGNFVLDSEQPGYWTGSSSRGALAAETCQNWTTASVNARGRAGAAITSQALYLISGIEAVPCSLNLRLLCMATDVVTTSTRIRPPASRLAFISKAGFTPGGGLAAGDALCQAEATAAGHSGTFLALLGTPALAPGSRFALTTPWYRVDGVRIAPTAAAMFSNEHHEGAIAMTADGEFRPFAAWSNHWNQPSSTFSCNGWVQTGSNQYGLTARASHNSRLGMVGNEAYACNQQFPIYCLEN